MEDQISSLDSFQTDEANSSARPESENTQNSYKDVEENTGPGGGGGGAANDGGDAAKNSNDPDDEGGANEDDFEQISEGTFEVDENSRATSAGPPPDDNAVERVGEEAGESRDFEEVDVNVSANNPSAVEESDMLGEADNTLPQSGDDDDNAMDVDQGENRENNDDEDSNNKNYERNDTEQQDESMEPLQQEADEDEREDDAEQQGNPDKNQDDSDKKRNKGKNKAGKNAKKDNETAEGDDDEPVENVQEPEESDVCLIPDDTESTVTDAEKEQAILARENAEKGTGEKDNNSSDKSNKEGEGKETSEEHGEADSYSHEARGKSFHCKFCISY